MKNKRIKRISALLTAVVLIVTLCCSLLVTASANVTEWTELPNDTSVNDLIEEYGDDVLLRIRVPIIDAWLFHNSANTLNVQVYFDNDVYQAPAVVFWQNVLKEHAGLVESKTPIDLTAEQLNDEYISCDGVSGVGTFYYAVPEGIGSLITDMFSGFGDTIDGLASGIKGMFNNIIWQDGTSDSGLSHFAIFGFVMMGLSLALGLGYVIIRKIRG